MDHFFARFGCPLLAKELVELAARRRTFVVRVIYALALYSAALWTYWRWIGQFPANSFEMLGKGTTLFNELLRWQFWGIYLFLPVVTSSAITSEKERETLPLLLMTKLGSWTILLEKLLSRLVAMASFLLLGLPLAAMAYSLGGVDVQLILKAAFVLSLTSLQVASFALLCSTWFRTTSSAFVGTYVLGAMTTLFGSEILKVVLSLAISMGVHKLPWPGLTEVGRTWFVMSINDNPSYRPLYGPWLLQSDPIGVGAVTEWLSKTESTDPIPFYQTSGVTYTNPRGINRYRYTSLSITYPAIRWITNSSAIDTTTLAECLVSSLPLIGSIMAFLVLTRLLLWRRMRVPEFSLFSRLFMWGDLWFHRLNHNPITRGFSFGTPRESLPIENPIAWRETYKNALGTSGHLFRRLVIVTVPVIAIIIWRLVSWNGQRRLNLLSGLTEPLWFVAILVVTIRSTGIIAGERTRQTLDVLLTTPLTSRSIALQKMAGLTRLILVLAIPLIALYTTQTVWDLYIDRNLYQFNNWDNALIPPSINALHDANFFAQGISHVRYSTHALIGRVLGVITYLALLGWVGFQCGMRFRNQTQAVWVTIILVIASCSGPSLILRGVQYAETLFRAPPQAQINSQIIRSYNISSIQDMSPSIALSPSIANNMLTPRPLWQVGIEWLQPNRVLCSEFYMSHLVDRIHYGWYPLLFHFSLSLGTLWLVRRNALARFGQFLGRTESQQ